MPITDETLNFKKTGQSTTPPKNLASRGLLPIPGPNYCDEVSSWTLEERFTKVLEQTLPKLSGSIYNEFAQIVSPASIAMIVGGLVVWVGSHAVFGAGLIVDCIAALFFCVGIIATGAELTRAASEFIEFMRNAVYGQNKVCIQRASQHLANFVSMVGVGVLIALITRQAKPVKRVDPKTLPPSKQLPPPTPKSATAQPRAPITGGLARIATSLAECAQKAGMVLSDAKIIAEVVRSQRKIILVRFTNRASTKWLAKGFPAKPISIKAKTNADGFVIARTPVDVAKADKAGYFIVGDDLIPRNAVGQRVDLPAKTEWPLQPGQIIDPATKKPLVGDYDLMGVVDPSSPGQNISAANPFGDQTNPIVSRIRGLINQKIGNERVMHGAHDNFGSIESAVSKAGDGVIAFMDDGTVRALSGVDEVKGFYRNELAGRQPATGRYEVPSLAQARQIVAGQNADDARKVLFLGDYRTTRPLE